ncbi:hypothetical protein HHI36_008425 [Cryptolaemus montrouzieri]|uniref:Uncharacterized protein n=1 Tax=Cryptolaemus montrouzieri TaxID=559131 RepID=A0ABD2MSJ2_9CUCU
MFRIMKELSENESSEISFNDPEDDDFEDTIIGKNELRRDSEQSLVEEGDKEASGSIDNRFYIGKDKDTLWMSQPPNLPAKKRIKSKNIVKIFSGPKRDAKNTASEMNACLLFIIPQIIDTSVSCTNKYIDKKHNDVNYS